jgi:hypothetical protein
MNKGEGKDLRRTLRHLSLFGGITMLLVPQIAMGGIFDLFDFTPSPPIYDRPFAIGTAESTVQLDLQIKKERFGWNFIVTFAFEKDAERRNVLKLLGHTMYVDGSYDKNEPGIDTPVRLEIERLDGEEAHAEDVWEFENMAPVDSVALPHEHSRIVYAREVHPHGVAAVGHHFFERTLGFLLFKPGKYRVTVTALKNIPEINSLKTSFSILSHGK